MWLREPQEFSGMKVRVGVNESHLITEAGNPYDTAATDL